MNIGAKNVLMAGVARNCARQIRDDVSKLRAALADFKQVSWLVIESDSDDDTLLELSKLAAEIPSFRYMSLGRLSERYPTRVERIAHCRNAYIDELKENPLYRDVDFVLIADLDGVNGLISAEAIASCFTRDDWDVCAANQQGRYYDIWALRHKVWCPHDSWWQAEFLNRYGLRMGKSIFAAVHSKRIVIPPDSPWIEVDSAFGGLALYRRDAIFEGEGRYKGVLEDGIGVCEHVPFHQRLRDKGFRIFINPALINHRRPDYAYLLISEERVRMKISGVVRKVKSVLGFN